MAHISNHNSKNKTIQNKQTNNPKQTNKQIPSRRYCYISKRSMRDHDFVDRGARSVSKRDKKTARGDGNA